MELVRFHKCRPKMNFPILAWIIMIFQGKWPWKKDAWSHMAIEYISETGNRKVCDVTTKSCRDRTRENFENDYHIIETKTRYYDISRKQFLEWYESHEGKEYDKLQISGLLSKVLGFISFNKFGHNFKKLICSELILSFKVKFDNLKVEDSDNWDLNMTWEVI